MKRYANKDAGSYPLEIVWKLFDGKVLSLLENNIHRKIIWKYPYKNECYIRLDLQPSRHI